MQDPSKNGKDFPKGMGRGGVRKKRSGMFAKSSERSRKRASVGDRTGLLAGCHQRRRQAEVVVN
jgi:hypothetical protein